MNQPITKKDEVIEEISGISVSDPYRWLEDSSNPEVIKWVNSQNEYLYESLKDKNFEIFSDELIKNFKVTNFSNPVSRDGRYFYSERKPDEDQYAIYMKVGLDGEPIKLIDPNGKKADNTVTIDFWNPSHDGKYIAYGFSQGGDEMATLYVLDVDKKENTKEEIPRCRYSSVRWLRDDTGFFYTRNPREGEVPENEAHLHTKVYFHKIGDNVENDVLIFGQNRPKDDMVSLSMVSFDDKYLAIHASQKWTENDVYIYDLEKKEIRPLFVGIANKFYTMFAKDKVIIDTNFKANNYRLISVPISKIFSKIDDWQELIPEREYLLQTKGVTASKIVVSYLVNASSKVFIFDHSGNEIEELQLPEFSDFSGLSTNQDEEEFFYSLDSFTFPKITYRHNPANNADEVYRKTENPIKPDDYIVKQEWFKSKDGTKIPMFIFHKKDIKIDCSNPTILYGYGGFGSISSPAFMRNHVPWLERGGVFALANIRGNGEFGEDWHKQGIKENKQNSFDDFISAGEYLIENKYTNQNKLGILGGSNGGLLTSAVAVQRPDLFKAVCSRVPLTDMVRFPLFGIASRWVHEYGNPSIKEELKNILKWSPYHNVKVGVEYPSILFTTGQKDTRVDPLHARKMSAMFQSVNKINPIYIYTETEAGHGQGKPIKKIVESTALILSFFAGKLGLKV